MPAPFNTTNTTNGAKLSLAGHIASILTALNANALANDVTGPMRSHKIPKPIRPTADERLKTARRIEARNVLAPSVDA